MKKFLIAIAGACILFGCRPPLPQDSLSLLAPNGNVAIVQVERADTVEARERGLMYRDVLAPDTGMFFVFDDSDVRYFWMKNTRIPLDVLFFDTAGNWISTSSMQPCLTDPCPNYSSGKPAQYALEVPLGWGELHSVGPGWRLLLP